MHRFDNLKIRQRPVITAVFYYTDSFIDPALRIHGDIQKALFLYLKHEGYKNIVFYSTVYGPNSFDKQMLVNFLNPDVSANVGTSHNSTVSSSESKGNNPFRRARQSANKEHVDVVEPSNNVFFDDRIGRYTKPGSSSAQNRGHEYGNRDANIIQLGYSLTRLSNSVLVLDSNYNEPECSEATSSSFYETVVKNLMSRYGETPNLNTENRVIVLMPTDSNNMKAVGELFKEEKMKSIFFTNINFRNLWRETMPMIDGISVPKEENGETVKRLSRNSFFLPAPYADDIKNIIEKEHLQYLGSKVEWFMLDELTRQLSILAALTGDEQHTLNAHRKLTLQAMSDNRIIGYETYKQMGNKKMPLEPKNDQKLDDLIGLKSVKETINGIKAQINRNKRRNKDVVGPYGNHMLFLGNPGTGKTTVARIVAAILKDLGVVSKGHLIEVSAENLVAGYVGQTAIKTTEVIDSAIGGVLFVDEAYRLAEGGSRDFGAEAVNTLLARMENDRRDLVVIFAGYDENMKSLYSINPGLKSRIRHKVLFDDYSADELKQIFILMANKQALVVNDEISQMLTNMMEYVVEYKNSRTDAVHAINAQRVNDNGPHDQKSNNIETYSFGNGRWVRDKLLAAVETKVSNRGDENPDADNDVLILDDFRNLPDIEELSGFVPGQTISKQKDNLSALKQLEKLIGIQSVKDYVKRLENEVEYINHTGGDTNIGTQHLLLYGNPGTGKTTVARLLAGIYHELNLLPRRNIVEVKREQLVVGFQGQTAPNVAQRIQASKGGVLFIDEAYSLYRGKDDISGKEAIDTLVSYLENNRNDLVVIMAGYEDRMKELLTEANDGLISRFANVIVMDDYSKEELYQIATSDIEEKRGYVLTDDAKKELMDYITPNKDNARWARNLVDKIVSAHRTYCVENANYSNQITISEIKSGISLINNTQIK